TIAPPSAPSTTEQEDAEQNVIPALEETDYEEQATNDDDTHVSIVQPGSSSNVEFNEAYSSGSDSDSSSEDNNEYLIDAIFRIADKRMNENNFDSLVSTLKDSAVQQEIMDKLQEYSIEVLEEDLSLAAQFTNPSQEIVNALIQQVVESKQSALESYSIESSNAVTTSSTSNQSEPQSSTTEYPTDTIFRIAKENMRENSDLSLKDI